MAAHAAVGNWFTVKEVPLVAVPLGPVTIIVPVVPLPTVTVTVDAVLAVIVAAVPPIVTAVNADKLVPFITTDEPTQPEAGNVVIVGGGIETALVLPTTIKLLPFCKATPVAVVVEVAKVTG